MISWMKALALGGAISNTDRLIVPSTMMRRSIVERPSSTRQRQ